MDKLVTMNLAVINGLVLMSLAVMDELVKIG